MGRVSGFISTLHPQHKHRDLNCVLHGEPSLALIHSGEVGNQIANLSQVKNRFGVGHRANGFRLGFNFGGGKGFP